MYILCRLYNSIIGKKCIYYADYINSHNLQDKLIDPSKKSKYTSDEYLYMYFLFHESGISFTKFYKIIEYAISLEGKDYPKKSCLHEFKTKLAKLNVNEDIINDFNTKHNALTGSISIDSTEHYAKLIIIAFN